MSKDKAVMTTGVIWNLFYADPAAWPEGAYHDDTLLAINGKEAPDGELENLAADAVIEIRSGYVMLPDGSDASLSEHFRKWDAARLGQGVVVGSFRVGKDKLEAVRAAILEAGGELIS